MSQWTLILGGVRSGKSRFALELIKDSKNGSKAVYLASAEVSDGEMKERIKRHQQERPSGWETVEAPRNVIEALRPLFQDKKTILWDCLTVYLGNRIYDAMENSKGGDGVFPELEKKITLEIEDVIKLKRDCGSHLTIVSNEVGHGVVPGSASGRFFRDLQGRLNQRLAAVCDHVYLVTAGIPQKIK